MKKFKTIVSLFMAVVMVCSLAVSAFAAPVDEATIDTSKTGSIDLYKYDLTNAEKDGVWDSSYVSTGVRDIERVENVLNGPDTVRHGDKDSVSDLGNGQTSNGYAIKGVEFSYLKVADICTYSQPEDGNNGETVSDNQSHVEVLYGFAKEDGAIVDGDILNIIGLNEEDCYAPASKDDMVYFQSDVLNNALKTAMANNPTEVKSALEASMAAHNGVAMPETDADGHSRVADLPLGLYLLVETRVPEMVTDTTAPFFVSLPMTSVNGTNATDGGTRWMYDVTLYPKNLTGIPSLEKTVREAKIDTGKNEGSSVITDGYAHNATASTGDVLNYQIISTLPTITSDATALTTYTFVDTMDEALSYTNIENMHLEWFKDKECTQLIDTWNYDASADSAYFTAAVADNSMTISMTAKGLAAINHSDAVYSDGSVNKGFSDCTLRITYDAVLNSNNSVAFGDAGNTNMVTMQWKRTNQAYFDTLVDDCHVYSYGIDLTKQFSDGEGDFSKVEFMCYNKTDDYYVQAALNADEGVYYVIDGASADAHRCLEADGTHFIPTEDGKIIIKGLEDDEYILTEVRTDNSYTLLKDNINVVISTKETENECGIYGEDVLGLIQNDPRYVDFVNAPVYSAVKENSELHEQTQLAHKLLTASAKVDGKAVTMLADEGNDSANAFAPLTVVNTHGFDLPLTGAFGNWMFAAAGLTIMMAAAGVVLFATKRNKKVEE